MEGHRRWRERLQELGAAMVAGSRPVEAGGRRFNEGFAWEARWRLTGHQRKRHPGPAEVLRGRMVQQVMEQGSQASGRAGGGLGS
ncbi:MAG: hypothetical protein JRN44_03470 [Nitrososphaerota archaeon]|nr:hypothetical protein [Nitrososphaerota archaeon]MDG6947564.1 hypothetical protein [Nitrososphaerota archaeon]